MPFFTVFKYCSTYEKFLAYFGLFCAVVAGFAAPWIAVVMGEIITIYSPTAT